jgi:protein transport protein SEC31
LSVRWNPHDPKFLCTSGDDCLTSFWTSEGELSHQIEHEGVPFEFEWNPQVPSMFATSLYNGKIQVKNVNYVGSRIVPNWLGEKVGCGFGFGGKVATFESSSRRVRLSKAVSENEFVNLYRSFQSLLQVQSAVQVCDGKLASFSESDSEEAQTWKFIRELFSANPNHAFRSLLGFTDTGASTHSAENDMNAEQFFDTFGSDKKDDQNSKPASSPKRHHAAETRKSSSSATDDEEVDKKIKHYLLIGNYIGAVDECFKSKRLADALLLSSLGGPELWASSQQRYVQSFSRPFVKNLMNAVVSHNFETMILEAKGEEWNETLSFLITYAKEQEFENLVNMLGAKLYSSGLRLPAVICSLLSGNMDLAVRTVSIKPYLIFSSR